MESDKRNFNDKSKSVRINREVVEAVADDCAETGVPIGRFFELAAVAKLSAGKKRKRRKQTA